MTHATFHSLNVKIELVMKIKLIPDPKINTALNVIAVMKMKSISALSNYRLDISCQLLYYIRTMWAIQYNGSFRMNS